MKVVVSFELHAHEALLRDPLVFPEAMATFVGLLFVLHLNLFDCVGMHPELVHVEGRCLNLTDLRHDVRRPFFWIGLVQVSSNLNMILLGLFTSIWVAVSGHQKGITLMELSSLSIIMTLLAFVRDALPSATTQGLYILLHMGHAY